MLWIYDVPPLLVIAGVGLLAVVWLASMWWLLGRPDPDLTSVRRHDDMRRALDPEGR